MTGRDPMTPAHIEQTVQLFVLQTHACVRTSLSAGRPPQPSSPKAQVVTKIAILILMSRQAKAAMWDLRLSVIHTRWLRSAVRASCRAQNRHWAKLWVGVTNNGQTVWESSTKLHCFRGSVRYRDFVDSTPRAGPGVFAE